MERETCALIIFTMVLVQTGTGINDDSKQSNETNVVLQDVGTL